MVLQEFVGEHN